MAFLATAKLSPTSRLILNHFEKNPKPQSAIDVSNAVAAHCDHKSVTARPDWGLPSAGTVTPNGA